MTAQLAQRPRPWHALLVLAVCVLVYWIGLGRGGFAFTEAHRVIPGWTMLDDGGWLTPRVFGQVYLRKPPGMAWAVAGTSAVLGQTEFGARAVSAASCTAMALLALWFGARWFGPRRGIAAGLAQALMPLLWPTGRAAEIEALNNFATQAAVLLLLDILVRPGRAPIRAILLGAAVTLAGLAKGPASAPVIVGSIIGACLALRSTRALLRPALWAGLVLAAVILGTIGYLIWRAVEATGQHPILQGPGEFLWRSPDGGYLLRVAALIPATLLSALPASLALVFPWGADAGIEQDANPPMARAVSWACLISLVLYAALGIDNPRYAMPAVVFIPVLAAYIARGAAGAFGEKRRTIASRFLLGRPWAWPVLLLIASTVYVGVFEMVGRLTSGQRPGLHLAAQLPDGAEILADGAVEARPETLLYAQRAGAAAGKAVRVRWVPRLATGALPPPGTYLLLRTDPGGDEFMPLDRAHPGMLEGIVRVQVHKYDFTLYRVRAEPKPE